MRNEIQVKRTAHYYTINHGITTREVLIVIHGYAQLASEFINEFNFLKDKDVLVVAPEGLSKFYGRDKKPVSSWMTSHERASEISDYNSYLNKLLKELKEKYQFRKITILGFSQGTSTALRWIDQLENEAIEFHLCSGSIPPEINKSGSLSKKISISYFYYGNNDRLMKPDQAEIAIKKLQELEINNQLYYFEGRHEVGKKTKEILLNKFT